MSMSEKIVQHGIEMEALKLEYNKYAAESRAALRLTLTRIENLKEALEMTGQDNPFDLIESRIKTFESVKGKCKTRGYELNIESIRENVKDVAGIRIVTKYIDDVQKLVGLLEKIPGLNIVDKKDYITEPKPNGYSSIHLGCKVEVFTGVDGSKLVPIEIQLRSYSMNLWATLEHDLKYKNENPSPEVTKKFKRIAEFLREFDEEAIALRDYHEISESNLESSTSKENAETIINMV